jgi:hypothetical protein
MNAKDSGIQFVLEEDGQIVFIFETQLEFAALKPADEMYSSVG